MSSDTIPTSRKILANAYDFETLADLQFCATIDCGFTQTRPGAGIRVRGIVIHPDADSGVVAVKIKELLDSGEVLLEHVGQSAGIHICDVWFKPLDGPQFLSLANSLVSLELAVPSSE